MVAALILALAASTPVPAAVVPAATAPVIGAPAIGAAVEADVRAAIVRAVQAKVAAPHAAVEVSIEALRIHGAPAGGAGAMAVAGVSGTTVVDSVASGDRHAAAAAQVPTQCTSVAG